MRIFKLLTTSLILAVIWLFIWQNISVFKTPVSFTMDLYVREQAAWSHQLYTILLFAGVLGLFAGIALMLKPYFKVRRLLARERQERDQTRTPQQPPPPKETASSEEAHEKTGEDR